MWSKTKKCGIQSNSDSQKVNRKLVNICTPPPVRPKNVDFCLFSPTDKLQLSIQVSNGKQAPLQLIDAKAIARPSHVTELTQKQSFKGLRCLQKRLHIHCVPCILCNQASREHVSGTTWCGRRWRIVLLQSASGVLLLHRIHIPITQCIKIIAKFNKQCGRRVTVCPHPL